MWYSTISHVFYTSYLFSQKASIFCTPQVNPRHAPAGYAFHWGGLPQKCQFGAVQKSATLARTEPLLLCEWVGGATWQGLCYKPPPLSPFYCFCFFLWTLLLGIRRPSEVSRRSAGAREVVYVAFWTPESLKTSCPGFLLRKLEAMFYASEL